MIKQILTKCQKLVKLVKRYVGLDWMKVVK